MLAVAVHHYVTGLNRPKALALELAWPRDVTAGTVMVPAAELDDACGFIEGTRASFQQQAGWNKQTQP